MKQEVMQEVLNQPSIQLRVYEKNTLVFQTYKEMHKYQTYEFVDQKLQKYGKLDNMKMNIKQALLMMDEFVDPTDPDVDHPNSVHAYQSAESIRKKHPLDEQLQVTGLIHDLGKVLFKFGEAVWAVGGDTFVVGCQYPKSIVFYDTLKENADWNEPRYNCKYGVYSVNCGLKNVRISFGHDEYMYQVLKNNKNHILHEKYWNMIRFHSFYPWHSSGEYRHLMVAEDYQILSDVIMFNQFDLYSKAEVEFVLTQEIKDYYDNLLHKFFPEDLQW